MKLKRSDLCDMLAEARARVRKLEGRLAACIAENTAVRHGLVEAQDVVDLHHDCREAEATIERQGRRVLELEAEVARLLADAGVAENDRIREAHRATVRELERVQGERDALESEVDRLRQYDAERARLAVLGALVEAMPAGCLIHLNTTGQWGYCEVATWQTVNDWAQGPADALRAAGVSVPADDGQEEREGVRS